MNKNDFDNTVEKVSEAIYEETKKSKKVSFEDLIKMFEMCDKIRDDNYKCSDCNYYKGNLCVGLDNTRDDAFDELLAEQQEQM